MLSYVYTLIGELQVLCAAVKPNHNNLSSPNPINLSNAYNRNYSSSPNNPNNPTNANKRNNPNIGQSGSGNTRTCNKQPCADTDSWDSANAFFFTTSACKSTAKLNWCKS